MSTAPSFIPDPDLKAGMVHRVSVLKDRNAGGAAVTPHGGATPDYQPVQGLESVECRLTFLKMKTLEIEGLKVPALVGLVQFATPTALDVTHRLLWADPDRGGRARTICLAGPTVAWALPDEPATLWQAEIYERFQVLA